MAWLGATGVLAQHGHGSEGVGTAHMATSCAPAVQAQFDRALALLHNFWYARALTQFQEIQKADTDCAMAHWGAAMTYDHPLWDAPTASDAAAAWAYVQKGLKAKSQNARERMYLLAVAALYKDAGAGTKRSRDEAYRDQMAATHAQYPDDETALFYGLSIIGSISEGTKGFEMQGRAVALFESVYARDRQHPGVLHYLIHAYDDPVHAERGLAAARVYARTAAAVPHAYHMPSHIFTRLGYWEEAAKTNENAWKISEDDVKAVREPGELRDFHSLNYLSYNYLQLGRYKDAKKTVDWFAAQDRSHSEPQDCSRLARPPGAPRARPDDLRVARSRALRLLRHARPLHRRIGIVERGADLAARRAVERFRSDEAASRSDGRGPAEGPRHRKHQGGRDDGASTCAGTASLRSADSDDASARAAAAAAHAAGDAAAAAREMEAAVAIEDSIDSLSQPPYPIIPAHELYGSMLMEMGRFAEARKHFEEALRRTPGRPKAIAGIARAAEAMGDVATAKAAATRLLEMWKNADSDRPELQMARRLLP